MPAAFDGVGDVDERLRLVLGQLARGVLERQRDVADRPVLRQLAGAVAGERADDLLDAGVLLVGVDDVVDRVLLLLVGELLARRRAHRDGVRPVGLLREARGQDVRGALAVGARQDEVVARLLADAAGHRGERDDRDEPDGDDDDVVARAGAPHRVQRTGHGRSPRSRRVPLMCRPFRARRPRRPPGCPPSGRASVPAATNLTAGQRRHQPVAARAATGPSRRAPRRAGRRGPRRASRPAWPR